MSEPASSPPVAPDAPRWGARVARGGRFRKRPLRTVLWSQREYLLLSVPCIAFFAVFHYAPMYGVIIAFKDFGFGDTLASAPWVGFRWFEEFLSSMYLWRVLRNTVVLSLLTLIVGFPVPILFALVVNEIAGTGFKRVVQTVSYMPHFISTVIVVGILYQVLSVQHGYVNQIRAALGLEKIFFLLEPRYFRTMYVTSEVWQGFGWGSIIYLAAMSSINPELYEAAHIDGALRRQQMWHVTLPGIRPTIVILLIFTVGNLMNVGFEKIVLLYNPAVYEVADVVQTYVYRRGIQEFQWSFAAAVGLFNSLINFTLLLAANTVSKRLNQASLW